MDKSIFLKTFNNHIVDFWDDILLLFPNEIDIKTAKIFMSKVIKIKKKIIIECWYKYIYIKYRKEIENNNYSFFINKNYKSDVGNGPILKSIEKIRNKAKNVSDENKEKICQYINNLSKLANLYYS